MAIVHEHVDVARPARERPDARHPFAELLGPVEVSEPLGGADARLVPGRTLAPVEADDLERDRSARQAPRQGFEIRVALARRREPLRHLEEEVAELARFLEGPEAGT